MTESNPRPNSEKSDSGATGPAADALAEYRKRRDFTRTAEPPGFASVTTSAESASVGTKNTSASSKKVGRPAGHSEHPVFVVQKHAASSLHYDFRLEMDGVLKSWAVPKGPSLDPADKRLAVMTEDHPLEYATFEGTIPENEYGGGTVMIWDFGWWEPDRSRTEPSALDSRAGMSTPESHAGSKRTLDSRAALAAGELKFILDGRKLSGSWTLVQMKGRGEKNWLLMKHRDEAARRGRVITDEAPDSVATGRSLDQIAADSTSRIDGNHD